jgi:hypothetical protein
MGALSWGWKKNAFDAGGAAPLLCAGVGLGRGIELEGRSSPVVKMSYVHLLIIASTRFTRQKGAG